MTKNEIEYERCVSCGEMTDVPVHRVIQKREFYLEGAGQLCIKCGYRLKVEYESRNKRKNDMGV